MILKEQDCKGNQWPLARITGVNADRNGDVRSVTLRDANSNNGNQTLRRPITKILCSMIFYDAIIDHTTLFYDIITQMKPLLEHCSFCPINEFCLTEAFNC